MSGKVLVTGATGFVGGELLVRLLAEESRPIICLVRAGSPAEARERGRQTLFQLTGSSELAGMVEWLPGDVTQPRLGLDRKTASRLAAELEEVFHCAAATAFDRSGRAERSEAGGRPPRRGPLEEGRRGRSLSLSEAHRANVQAVAMVHRLCAEAVARGGFRRLHHVSTAYAAGLSPGPLHPDCLPEDRAELFRNTYERTKARAERFLRARWERVPTTIYRPSIVVGESETGRTSNWNVIYQPMRSMVLGRLPFLPRSGLGLLDCVPVDFVAAGILALARREDTAGRAFHLVAGDEAITVDRVVEETFAALSRRGRGSTSVPRTRVLGALGWGLLRRALPWFHADARRAFESFSVYEGYTGISQRFDDHRERGLLHASGVVLPSASEFFPRVVEYALKANFGRPAKRSTPPRRLRVDEPITAELLPAAG